eukprot:m.253654 g.253654  ORF g.253654 m.253654 type:complete len:320 (+) comp16161_c1_seq1:531-1490(+)
MAVGDSITAAFAARGFIKEDRDISWAIGRGLQEQITVPYMISQYVGTDVDGSSLEPVIPNDPFHLPHNDYHPMTDRMNVAESEGAVHRGSLDEQWQFLQTQIKKRPDFNDDNKWKVLTVWMIANDVCGECNGPVDVSKWSAKTDEFLTNVSSTMKNVYVSLQSLLDLSNVARIQRANVGCDIEHRYILVECDCVDRGNSTQLKQLDENVHTFNNEYHALAAKWQSKLKQEGRTDMAVVTQGFLEGQGSILDRSFLSELDCFHPAAKSHEDLAIGMWNTMLCHERKDLCGMKFKPGIQPVCPTEESTFYTGPDVIPTPSA